MIFFKFIECISTIISITEKILLNDYLLLFLDHYSDPNVPLNMAFIPIYFLFISFHRFFFYRLLQYPSCLLLAFSSFCFHSCPFWGLSSRFFILPFYSRSLGLIAGSNFFYEAIPSDFGADFSLFIANRLRPGPIVCNICCNS